MADEIRMDIVTPRGIVVSEMVSLVQYEGPEGLTTIMRNHAPMMTVLDISAIRYVQNDEEYYIAVSEGYLEIDNNVVIILTNTVEHADEIDVERAKAAEQRARDRLAGRAPDKKYKSSQKALKRALTRQRVVEKSQKH